MIWWISKLPSSWLWMCFVSKWGRWSRWIWIMTLLRWRLSKMCDWEWLRLWFFDWCFGMRKCIWWDRIKLLLMQMLVLLNSIQVATTLLFELRCRVMLHWGLNTNMYWLRNCCMWVSLFWIRIDGWLRRGLMLLLWKFVGRRISLFLYYGGILWWGLHYTLYRV